MNALIVEKDGIWHTRPYGTQMTLCRQIVGSDVSPGISQEVFERLDGEKAPRCPDCEEAKFSVMFNLAQVAMKMIKKPSSWA